MGRVGVGIWRQQPFIVRLDDSWRLWVSFNNDVTSGTYYDLYDNGILDIVTVEDNQVMEARRVNTK